MQLWSMRKKGSSLRTVLYSNPLTAIPGTKGNPPGATVCPFNHSGSHAVDHDGKIFVANCCDLSEKVDSMWSIRVLGAGGGVKHEVVQHCGAVVWSV